MDDDFEDLGPPPIRLTSRGCGCTETEYEGGRKEHKTCIICALHWAGTMLQEVSARMREEREGREAE